MKPLDLTLLTGLCDKASESDRRRAHHNLHEFADDPTQRLLIAMQPGTYVAVHRHALPGRWELLTVLQGEVECLIFDDEGVLEQRQRFAPGKGSGIEFAAGVWHTVRCLQENTVILEVKPGPFDPTTAAEMAEWCPKEGDERVGRFADWLETAETGSRFRILEPV